MTIGFDVQTIEHLIEYNSNGGIAMARNMGGMRGDEEKEPIELAVRAVIIAFLLGIIVGAFLHSTGILTAYITS